MVLGRRRWLVAAVVGLAALLVWPAAALLDRAFAWPLDLRLGVVRVTSVVDLGLLGLLVLVPLTAVLVGVIGLTTVRSTRRPVLAAVGWVVGAAVAALLAYLVATVLGFVLQPVAQGFAGH